MYNGNTVIEREIKEKYNEVFKIIGEKVGLRKLTYETYMGLRDGDTRKNKFKSFLEEELRDRKSDDIRDCIDIINKDVKREDRLNNDIDIFFKLGEKIYPKEEEKENRVSPTPDRLFEVHNDEEVQEEEIEDEIDEDENKKDKLKEKIDVKKEILKALKRAGIVIVGALDFISLTLLVGAITTGILSGGLTFGTIALFSALPAATLAVIYRNIRKKKKKELSKKKKEEKNKKTEIKEEKDKDKTKTNTKTETTNLDFRNDLDSPTELKFDEDMEEDKPLEADAISEPMSSGEEDAAEKPAEEMPEVETELSNSDSEEPLIEPEYEEKVTENKISTNKQPSSWMNTMKPNFWVNDDNQKMTDSKNKSSWMDTMKPNFWVNDNNQKMTDTKNESSEQVSNSINKNNNNFVNDRRSQTISEIEQRIMEINKKIEGYEQTINKANQRMKEIQDNKYGYPNQNHVDAHHVAKPKREYNELKSQKLKALQEMKKYQDIVHELSENVDKISGTEVPPLTEEVTIHKVPINNWETKDIYIVHEQNPRKKSNDDYTDKFENSHKK